MTHSPARSASRVDCNLDKEAIPSGLALFEQEMNNAMTTSVSRMGHMGVPCVANACESRKPHFSLTGKFNRTFPIFASGFEFAISDFYWGYERGPSAATTLWRRRERDRARSFHSACEPAVTRAVRGVCRRKQGRPPTDGRRSGAEGAPSKSRLAPARPTE